MRKQTTRWLSLLGALLACWPVASSAESLFDAIRLAYETNPSLRGQRADLRGNNEEYVQARAGYGPQLSISGQVAGQTARVQEPASFFTPAATTAYRAYTGSVDLSLTQPLYTAGALKAQLGAAQDNVLAGRETLRQAESQLILKVVTAYVDVTRDRKTLKVIKDEIDVLAGELDETKAKGKLGVLSKTDVAEAEARLLAAQAQLNDIEGRLDTSNAEYLNAVGQTPGELEAEPNLPGIPERVDEAFEAADHNNPQISGAIEAERVAREQVNQAKAANGPTVSLKIDAAVIPIEPYLPRQYDQSVTAAVVFNQPLFTSGINSSKIREAIDKDDRAELDVETQRRDVVQMISQAWAQLGSARRALVIEERQVSVETVAAEGNRVEERAGLRTTIDLLNAESERANSQLSLIQSRHDEYLARANLLSAMGLLEARFLVPSNRTYKPEAALSRVVTIGAMPWEGTVHALDGVGAPKSAEPQLSRPNAGAERPVNARPLPPTP
jgi:outer membrane protein